MRGFFKKKIFTALITDYLEPQNLCRRLFSEILLSLTWVGKFLRIRGIAGYVQKRNAEEQRSFLQSPTFRGARWRGGGHERGRTGPREGVVS